MADKRRPRPLPAALAAQRPAPNTADPNVKSQMNATTSPDGDAMTGAAATAASAPPAAVPTARIPAPRLGLKCLVDIVPNHVRRWLPQPDWFAA